jgi:hypothetical protein
MPFRLASRVSQRSVSHPLAIYRNEYPSRTLLPVLPPSEAELSTPFRELANEDWLPVERPDVALDNRTQALYRLVLRPADTALASEDRATSCKRLPHATSAHFGRAEMRYSSGPLRRQPSRPATSVAPRCFHLDVAERRDALPPP